MRVIKNLFIFIFITALLTSCAFFSDEFNTSPVESTAQPTLPETTVPTVPDITTIPDTTVPVEKTTDELLAELINYKAENHDRYLNYYQ